MVAAFDYCLHGKGGAAPSIDTAMHGLVDAAHVDHLHPDSGIAIATAADGEALTKEIFGDEGGVGALAAARFPAGSGHRQDQGARTRRRSGASSAATASPPGEPRRRSPSGTRCGSSTPPPTSSPSTPRPSRSARRSTATARCPRPSGGPRRPRLAPTLRSIASTDKADGRPLHRRRRGAGLPGRGGASAAGGAGHELPRSLPAHQGEAAGAGSARGRQRGGVDQPGCASCTRATGPTTRPTTTATPPPSRRPSAAPTR